MSALRILIVDDHEVVRSGLRSLLASHKEWEVCGEAADGLEAVEKAKALRPDLALMDISMPRMNGLDATRIIRRDLPQCQVIMVSMNDPAVASRLAQEADAAAYVSKSETPHKLLATIEKVVGQRGAPVVKSATQEVESGSVNPGEQDNSTKAEERATGLLAAIVDSSDDAIVSKSLQGIITSWNKSAERLFGYTAEEAIGQHITLIIPEERRGEETEILERLKRGERVDHFETVRRRKDGALLDVSLTISPVKDDAGRVVGASKVARDVTERKRIEQILAERALLLDLSNDAILVRDAADRIAYWNNGALELYGYSREEASGRVSHELLRTKFPEPPERIFAQLHRDGRWTGELIHTCKDGSQIVVASRWVLDRDAQGNVKRILETNNDVTQQRENEKALRESENRLRTLTDTLESQVQARTAELEQRNREVLDQSEQLRDLSHRLMQIQDNERRHIARELHDSAGQILAGLSMTLGTVVRHAKATAPELAKDAEEAQSMAQELSQEIRTTSYLLHPPMLDESGLRDALLWYIQGLKERSGLDIQLAIAQDFGRLSSETELLIFRAVQECLTNVHRHSGSKVAAIRIARNGQGVSLEVQDEGQGIPREKLTEIQSQRAGVGLRGMRERALQLGGELRIQSDGRGTKVSVTVPTSERVKEKAAAERGSQMQTAG